MLGPFTITPYRVDHSAYESYAFLVEADGRRLFYSGDFRCHGRTMNATERLIANPPGNVDVLLMEGTCLSPTISERGSTLREQDLVARFVSLFEAPGLALVWASPQNIDRIVTLVKACNKAARTLIIDLYAACILEATGNPRVPQAWWNGIRVFVPESQKRRVRYSRRFELLNDIRSSRVFPEKIPGIADRSVMLFRPSMMGDIDSIAGLRIGTLIVSLWRGYLETGQGKELREWAERRQIPITICHTSGHATVEDLIRFRNAFPAASVVPIHTQGGDEYGQYFYNVARVGDGEWCGV